MSASDAKLKPRPGRLVTLPPQREREPVLDPFEVTKHAPGSHDQKSHGNWARGRTVESFDDLRVAIRSALPHANVAVDHGTDLNPKMMQGIADGLTKMAAEFPSAAKNVVLVKVGPQHMTTNFIAEVEPVMTRDPNFDPVEATRAADRGEYISPFLHGYGISFNADKMQTENWLESVLQLGGNTMSGGAMREWAENVVTHEWGHVVHNTALMTVTGESAWKPVYGAEGLAGVKEPNQKLWIESVIGPGRRKGSGTTFYGSNDTVARWADTLDTALTFGMMDPPRWRPSRYAMTSRAELVAETFNVRNGPGAQGTIIPEVDAIVAEMEELAR